MKTLLNIFGWIFINVVFLSCSSPHKETEETIMQLDTAFSKNIENYIVLPNQGCEGCITEGEAFVKNNYKKIPNTKFIFTKVNSVKLLRAKLGDSLISAPNVIIDSLNIYKFTKIEDDIYPNILYLKSGKIKSIDIQKPGNEALTRMKVNKKKTRKV